jgi:hypothetical protein
MQMSAYGDDGCRRAAGTLQLVAGNSVARFLPAESCLELRGHRVKIEFLGTRGVRPRLMAENNASPVASALPRRVVYAGMWPGIRVVFALDPDGGAEIAWLLAKGAEVSHIRVRYSVPVEIRDDGTLRFLFPTGPVTESSPEAWQAIDGKRVAVGAAFAALADGAIGFRVGSYDPRYPLTIDPAW